MGISALAYLGIRSDRTEDWSDFAGRILGMQEIDRGGSVRAYRMDDRTQRLVVSDEPGETLAFMGWEVEARRDLATLAARLSDAGHTVEPGAQALADRRFVEALIVTHDPAGNRIEIVWNPMRSDDPFRPGRPIDGFVTGAYGMGHAVLHVADADALLPFYRDTLGFHVSDYALSPVPLYFLPRERPASQLRHDWIGAAGGSTISWWNTQISTMSDKATIWPGCRTDVSPIRSDATPTTT